MQAHELIQWAVCAGVACLVFSNITGWFRRSGNDSAQTEACPALLAELSQSRQKIVELEQQIQRLQQAQR